MGGGEKGEGWGAGGGADVDSADNVCAKLPVVADVDANTREEFCRGTEGLPGDGDAAGGQRHWVGGVGVRLIWGLLETRNP